MNMRILKYIFVILIGIGLTLEFIALYFVKEYDYLFMAGIICHGVGVALQIIHYVIEVVRKRKQKHK